MLDLGFGQLQKLSEGLFRGWGHGVDFLSKGEIGVVKSGSGKAYPAIDFRFGTGMEGQIEAKQGAALVVDLLNIPVRAHHHDGLADLIEAERGFWGLEDVLKVSPEADKKLRAEQ